ncbi:MAG: hypothetical protein IPI20_21125 [Rhodoferax sp.]|nr:hypothetical protein [Rhodoferax sp.]
MTINTVGKKVITASGGAQTLLIQDPLCALYYVSFTVVGGTPAAGTTAVAFTPFASTSETLLDEFGTAINIDPTALKMITVPAPTASLTFTPTSWSVGVSILVTVMADTNICYIDKG